MISTGDQRDVAQYIAQPWLMTYVNARTISTAHSLASEAALLTHNTPQCTITDINVPNNLNTVTEINLSRCD